MLDSGISILKGIVELRKKGIFSGAFIMKCQYLPAMVPFKAVDLQFEDKAMVECNPNSCKFDGKNNFVWGIKHSDWSMKIMSKRGALVSDDMSKKGSRNWIDELQKNFDWHIGYQHIVDDCNNLHHTVHMF